MAMEASRLKLGNEARLMMQREWALLPRTSSTVRQPGEEGPATGAEADVVASGVGAAASILRPFVTTTTVVEDC